MTQTTNDKRGILLRNLGINPFDSLYRNGDRASNIYGVQLAPGHFLSQRYAMHAVYPRPDNEGNTFARHRYAYYDGINEIQYEVPLKAFGGAAPHRFQIISAPPGTTVEAIYGDPKRHGVVKWTPTQDYTNTPFVIRMHGQDGNYTDFSWTCSTSIIMYIFLSGTGNDSTGDGSHDLPWRTLAKVFGGSRFTETYPGKHVILMEGNYETAPHSDGGNRVRLRDDFQPVVYMTYPGDTAYIDMAPAEFMLDGNDNWWSGSTTGRLIFQGSCTVTAEAHNFWVGEQSKRTMFAWIDFDAFEPRVAGDFTNSVPIFMHQSNTNPDREYASLHDVQEINRTIRIGNDGYITICFGTRYLVLDYCGNGEDGGLNFKDTCYNTSVRYTNMNNPDFALAFMCQNASDNNEICFSKLRGRLFFNFQDNPVDAGKIVSWRNTIWTDDDEFAEGIYARDSENANFQSFNDIVVSPGPAIIHSLVSVTDAITARTDATDMPINSTTLELVNDETPWRTNELGITGCEIA